MKESMINIFSSPQMDPIGFLKVSIPIHGALNICDILSFNGIDCH